MTNATSEAELIKFEKWVETELGSEIVKKIRSNAYINYGSMKQLWDFVFENVYCPKFVKLVRMNLSLDSVKHTEDSELTELKNKEIELDKKLAELRLESQKQDDEISSVVQSINEIESSPVSEELDNKTVDLLIQEIYLKQAERTVKSFDDTIKKLTIKNSNEDANSVNMNFDQKRQNVEKILNQYQTQMKNKLNMQTDASKSGASVKLNQLNVKEIVSVLSELETEEIRKLNEMMSESNIEKEVELLKYRIENTKLIDNRNTAASNQSLNDALSLQNLEFIEKNCEIMNMKQEKQLISEKINEMRSKISILFKNKSDDLQNLKLYLKTLLEYKRAETNFNELEKFLSEIELEIKGYEERSNLTVDKLTEIKRLQETINKNKKQIEQLAELNSNSITKPIDLQNQIEDTIESLPDQMRQLNLNQSTSLLFNSTSISPSMSMLAAATPQSSLPVLDDYFINDYEQFKAKLKPNQIQTFNSAETAHAKCIPSLVDFLNYPDYKSKHCVLDELMKIINFIEKHNSTENIDTVQTLNDLTHLENSLEKCREHEREQVPKYTDLINKRIDMCHKWKNSKQEKESMIEEWYSQPAAFECTFSNCTVDGKSIDYYYNIIEEGIAKHAANKNLKL